MFEELAAQGRSMLKRLEAERALAQSERDALPAHERVAISEATDRQQRVDARVGESCGADAQARLSQIHRDELGTEASDGYTPTIDAYHRVVDLLDELDAV